MEPMELTLLRAGAHREKPAPLCSSFPGAGGWLPLVVMTESKLPSSTFREQFTLLFSCFRLYGDRLFLSVARSK